jgi:hypothetical protein
MLRGDASGDGMQSSRIWTLVGVGLLGLIAIFVIPGPQFEPYRRPPDRTLRVVDTLAGTAVEGTDGRTRAITHPKLLNHDETLAYLGNDYNAYFGQERATEQGVRGTVELEMRLNENGEYSGIRRRSGTGLAAQVAEATARYYRFSPALDEAGRPVAVWWPITITLPPPMSLELTGMYRHPDMPYREIPPGGFTIEDLLDDERPTFTPLTELPEILNPQEVAEAAPSALSATDAFLAEIPVYFLIDTVGAVRRIATNPSGDLPGLVPFRELASRYRFSPARKNGAAVPVWIRIFLRIPPPRS